MRKLLCSTILILYVLLFSAGCNFLEPQNTVVSHVTTKYTYQYCTPTPMPTPVVSYMDESGSMQSLDDAIEFALLINPSRKMTQLTINTGIPLFTNADFEKTSTEFTTDSQGRPSTAFAIVTIETTQMDVDAYSPISIESYSPPGWSDSKYVRKVPLISDKLCGYRLPAGIITGTKTLKSSLDAIETKVLNIVTKNPDLSVLYRVTPVYKDNNILPYGLIVEAYSIEDSGKAISICYYLLNNQSGRRINYATGKIS